MDYQGLRRCFYFVFMDVSTFQRAFSYHLSNQRVCFPRSKPVKCRALSFVTVLIGIIILEILKTISRL